MCKLLTAADTYRVNPVTGYENKYVYAVYMQKLMPTVKEEDFYDFSIEENIDKQIVKENIHYKKGYIDIVKSRAMKSQELIFKNGRIDNTMFVKIP